LHPTGRGRSEGAQVARQVEVISATISVGTPVQLRLAPYDFLATSYTWDASGRSITFVVRPKVDFSDGTPMTPANVHLQPDEAV